jgi:hypothetical protein
MAVPLQAAPRADHFAAAENWRLNALERIDPQVRVFGNVAALIHREAVSGSCAGRPYHESKDDPPDGPASRIRMVMVRAS